MFGIAARLQEEGKARAASLVASASVLKGVNSLARV